MHKKIVLLLIFFICCAGCFQDPTPKSNRSDNVKQENAQQEKVINEFDKLLKERYFNNPRSIRKLEPDHSLQLDNIKITKENNYIAVRWNDELVEIELPENYMNLTKAEVSSDQKYLAIEAAQHEGRKVYVVNMDSKEILNVSNEEVVMNPTWSPDNHLLAVVIGRIGDLLLALFDPSSEKKTIYTTTEKYISILGIKWGIDGSFIDYVAEEHSDTFALYRYHLVTNKLVRIAKISWEQFQTWQAHENQS